MTAAGRGLAVDDVSVRYGDTAAVDHVSLDLAAGQVLALLGPNGAGKTTTVEVCEGFVTADAGEVRVLGADPAGAAEAASRSAAAAAVSVVVAGAWRMRGRPRHGWRWGGGRHRSHRRHTSAHRLRAGDTPCQQMR